MRFIKVWSYSCAKYLTRQLDHSHEKRGVYYYGFQVVIGAIVKGILLSTIALILGVFQVTMAIMAVFATLRILAGGYHMDTYGKCISISLVLFISAGLIAQYTQALWSLPAMAIFIAASFIIGFAIILKKAPVDTPNKPITKPAEIKRFRILSIAYAFVWVLAASTLLYFGLGRYVIAVCLGFILETLMLTQPMHVLMDSIKDYLNSFNKRKKAARCSA